MDRIRAIATLHRREMNHTEKRYAKFLKEQLDAGQIRWALFEPWKLRLADNTWYTPDFIVIDKNSRVEAHEVKAEWSSGKTGWREDARVKIKCAAEMHPMRFLAVTERKDGSWDVEEFLREREEPEKLDKSVFVGMVEIEDKVKATPFDTAADADRAFQLVRYACTVMGELPWTKIAK
jgi:hypothetical protein